MRAEGGEPGLVKGGTLGVGEDALCERALGWSGFALG